MDVKAKTKLKRRMGLAIPLMIIVITITAVGASYAWFSDSAVAEIATINLATAPVFTLEFNVASGGDLPENSVYNGQIGVRGTDSANGFTPGSNGGYLVTNERAASIGQQSNNLYLNDRPYEFVTKIQIDTSGQSIPLNVRFDQVQVAHMQGEEPNQTPDLSGTHISLPGNGYTQSAIDYGFTWYFYDTRDSSVLYTPYGITDGANKINTIDTSPLARWTSTPVKQNISNFSASLTDENDEPIYYMFVIVFAPEKLFWMQYSQNDYTKSLNDVYAGDLVGGSMPAAYNYARGYTDPVFAGTTFKFTVTFERAV